MRREEGSGLFQGGRQFARGLAEKQIVGGSAEKRIAGSSAVRPFVRGLAKKRIAGSSAEKRIARGSAGTRFSGGSAARRFAAGFLCMQLAVSGCVYCVAAEADVPDIMAGGDALQAVAFTAGSDVPDSSLARVIDSSLARVIDGMLAKGEYVEGEAIALVRKGAGRKPDGEAISEVSGENVMSAVGDALKEMDPAAEEALRRLSAFRSEGIWQGDADRISSQDGMNMRFLQDDADSGFVQSDKKTTEEEGFAQSDKKTTEEKGFAQPDKKTAEEMGFAQPDKKTAVEMDFAQGGADMVSGQEDVFTVCHITDHDRSTKEILLELYSSPDTIAAEPNYVLDTEGSPELSAGADETDGMDGADETDGTDAPRVPMPGDLSVMQWDLGKAEGKVYTAPISPDDGYLLAPPLWMEGHNDPEAGVNSSGTVCIMDSGIDVTNPEFDGVLYEFSEEQQMRLGCGRHGFNASVEDDDGDVGDLTDHNMHGTHVAGIIAANWDGHGISGIVNGAKIFGVRIYKDDGTVSDEASTLRGFEFLIKCAKEVNLKAVNCSWGYIRPELIQSVLVDALGAQGAVTVYASGNRSLDVDETPDSGPSNPSIYAVSVNGAGMDGKMGDYSCWGQTSTDVFGPGSSILSTVPEVVESGVTQAGMTRSVYRHFFPELTQDAHLLYGVDRMEKGKGGVRFFDRNPALHADAKEIGEYTSEYGFDDRESVQVDITRIGPPPEDRGKDPYDAGSFYMAIPAADADEVKWVSAKAAVDRGAVSGKIASVTCVNEEGEIVELDHTAADALKKGISSMCSSAVYSYQWTMYSVDIQGYVDASNEVHGMSAAQRDENFEFMDYEDPGRIDGVYAWKDGGQEYVIVEVAAGDRMPDKPKPEYLFVDNVALGDGEVVNGAYVFMSGTSMATPSVSASLAVIAKDEPENASLDDAQLGELALKRVAKLYAAAEYDPDLADKCRTGGRIVLGRLADGPADADASMDADSPADADASMDADSPADADASMDADGPADVDGPADADGKESADKLAPLIDRAECDGVKMTLRGFFFGDSGTLQIDGSAHDYTGWSDGEVTADLSDIASGSHVAKITNAQGIAMQAIIAVGNPDSGTPLLENALPVPVEDPAILEDMTAFFYGQMTQCGGKLYAVSTYLAYEGIALWCFDPEARRWEKCANLPEMIAGNSFSGVAGYRGQVYIYGTANEDDGSCLWSYDPAEGVWTEHPLEDPPTSLALCVFRDRLFGVGYGVSDDDCVCLVDPVKNRIEPIADSELPDVELENARMAATESCLYVYAPDPGDDEPEHPAGALVRITCGEDVDGGRMSGCRETEETGEIETEPETEETGEIETEPATEETGEIETELATATAPESETAPETEADPDDADKVSVHIEDLTDVLNGLIDKNHNGAVALAAGEDYCVIVADAKDGKDMHILRDNRREAEAAGFAAAYHTMIYPMAVMSEGTLYVCGMDETAPDIMFFRSGIRFRQ